MKLWKSNDHTLLMLACDNGNPKPAEPSDKIYWESAEGKLLTCITVFFWTFLGLEVLVSRLLLFVELAVLLVLLLLLMSVMPDLMGTGGGKLPEWLLKWDTLALVKCR